MSGRTILKEVMDAQLSDQIYECSFVPESWPRVLGQLAALAEARVGFLFISNNDIHHWTSSTDAGVEALEPLVKSGWVARSERFKRVRANRHSGFVTEPDLYTPEEFRNDPFYRDILYPLGLGWATGTAIELPTGDTFTISLEREYARGPIEPCHIQTLDELRPHIARSALMSARLQLERARAASATLAAIGLAALLLDETGKVLAANNLIEVLDGYIRWRAHDRVSLCDKSADELLRGALAAMRQAVTHSGGSTEALAGLAQAHAVMGDKLAMERIVKELGERDDRYVSPYNIARVYGAIDDKQRTLEWLERAYREHNPDLIELTREPSFAGLHSDAKFRELVQRIGWHSGAGD